VFDISFWEEHYSSMSFETQESVEENASWQDTLEGLVMAGVVFTPVVLGILSNILR